MASITIHNLDDEVINRLKMRADAHNRSMAEEVRAVLQEAVADEFPTSTDLISFTRECFAEIGPFDLELPVREPMREPPDFH